MGVIFFSSSNGTTAGHPKQPAGLVLRVMLMAAIHWRLTTWSRAPKFQDDLFLRSGTCRTTVVIGVATAQSSESATEQSSVHVLSECLSDSDSLDSDHDHGVCLAVGFWMFMFIASCLTLTTHPNSEVSKSVS